MRNITNKYMLEKEYKEIQKEEEKICIEGNDRK